MTRRVRERRALRLRRRDYQRLPYAPQFKGRPIAAHANDYRARADVRRRCCAPAGRSPPHMPCRGPRVMEREATYHAIPLAKLVGQPIHVFHVSCGEVHRRHGAGRSRRRQRPCAARAHARQAEGLWDAIRAVTLDVISSGPLRLQLRRERRQVAERTGRRLYPDPQRHPRPCRAARHHLQ